MRRDLFTAEHEDFRLLIREFVLREIAPCYADWEKAGEVPREFFRKLGDIGVMGMAIPERYGGSGNTDYRYNVILQEEAARALVTMGTVRTQLDVILPYFLAYCSADQRARWFPGLAAGELLTAIAMTEPGTGSDLAGVRTRAVRDGDCYVLTGAKTFITGGALADLVIVVARTSDPDPSGRDRRAGLTLLVVEDGMPGFSKGRKLDKIGLKVQDTAELSFSDVRVPVANRLGADGAAFGYLGHNLPQERMTIAVGSVAQARAALDATVSYVSSRQVFGQPLGSFQNTKFELAAVAAEVEAGQALLDRALLALVAGELSGADAAIGKLFCTEMQARVVDRCLQLFGGYGYITEFPIARLYADARVTRIYGGTSEVMKSIISKSLGLLAMRITGISALVTGGASGLGFGTARYLVERGARVVLLDLPGSAGEQAAKELGSAASFVAADITDTSGVEAALDAAEGNGPLRAVVHCAGRGGDRFRILDKQRVPGPLDAFAEVVRINLVGTYNVLRLAAARMSGNEPVDDERGAIVLTASVAAFEGQIGQTSYAAAKSGVRGITIVAARDLASWQIRVNTIAPGIMDTPMLARLRDDIRDGLAASVPYPKRLGTPADYAQLAASIIENPYLNGEVIRLDGAIRMAPR